MIRVEKRKAETTIEVFTCEACDTTTSFRHPLAQHIVARHLPHLDRARATLDRVGIRCLVWCAAPADHAILCAAERVDHADHLYAGPGWYAVEATKEWDGEDEAVRIRIVALIVLVREAEERAAQVMADAMTFRRLAEAPVTAPMEPPPGAPGGAVTAPRPVFHPTRSDERLHVPLTPGEVVALDALRLLKVLECAGSAWRYCPSCGNVGAHTYGCALVGVMWALEHNLSGGAWPSESPP